MFALNLKITQMEIQIKVVKCPTKRGYSLQHNQYKGWGIMFGVGINTKAML
jgi:hypothetical protein